MVCAPAVIAGADPLRWRTVDGRRRAGEPFRPERSGGPEWPGFLQRSDREEPVCRGLRAASRGVTQRRGKNLDTMVSGGPAPSIGPAPEQGIGPRGTAADLTLPTGILGSSARRGELDIRSAQRASLTPTSKLRQTEAGAPMSRVSPAPISVRMARHGSAPSRLGRLLRH